MTLFGYLIFVKVFPMKQPETEVNYEQDFTRVNRYIYKMGENILVPIALFSSLSRRGLGTRIDSSAKAPPAKR